MNDESLDRLDHVSRGAIMLVIVIFTVMAFYIGLGIGSLLGIILE